MAATRATEPVERLAYRVVEFAEAVGVSRWTIARLIERGEIATSRVGSVTVITADEGRRYLALHQTRASLRTQGRGEGT